MYSVERKVGRLVEARVLELRTIERAETFSLAIREAVMSVAPARGVICADHRAVKIYPPEVAARLVELFVRVNASLERAALIISPSNATLSMQVQRIVRESENPLRRVFVDVPPMLAYLGEVLTPAELAAARAHLKQDSSPPSRRA